MTEFVEVKTSELSGAALDWAVAQVEKVEGLVVHKGQPAFERDFDPDCWADDEDMKLFKCWRFYSPSTDWGQGGPLISKYQMDFCCEHPETIGAALCDENGMYIDDRMTFGKTHLIAACRALVAHKLGDAVSVPKELLS